MTPSRLPNSKAHRVRAMLLVLLAIAVLVVACDSRRTDETVTATATPEPQMRELMLADVTIAGTSCCHGLEEFHQLGAGRVERTCPSDDEAFATWPTEPGGAGDTTSQWVWTPPGDTSEACLAQVVNMTRALRYEQITPVGLPEEAVAFRARMYNGMHIVYLAAGDVLTKIVFMPAPGHYNDDDANGRIITLLAERALSQLDKLRR